MNKETININNYESFYIDFLEGNLSVEMKALFEQFLENNPDLIEEDMDLSNLSNKH